MKAAVIEKPNELKVQSIEDPTPKAGEVVVKVDACGICGTDIHVFRGEFAPTKYPIVPGHEFCGEVVDLAAGVKNLRVGDFVAVDPSLFDGSCRQCRAGHFNLCENWNAIGVGSANGASAEFVAVPAANAFRVPAEIPRDWGALVEPLSCAVHGLDMVDARVGGDWLIYGAGTMGLMLGQLVRHSAGPSRIDVVERNPARHELAKRLAADSVAATADELDHAGGWDVVIDATGVVPAIEDGLRRVARGGTFLMFGVANADATATFSPFRVYNDEIRIVGSMAILHSFERALSLLVKGVIDCKAMITTQFSLDDYPKALDAFLAGRGLKTQVKPGT